MDDQRQQRKIRASEPDVTFSLSKSSSKKKRASQSDELSFQIESEKHVRFGHGSHNKRELMHIEKQENKDKKHIERDILKLKNQELGTSRKAQKKQKEELKEKQKHVFIADQAHSHQEGQDRPGARRSANKKDEMSQPTSQTVFRQSRVSAHSSVNFDFLTSAEQKERYKNMLIEYFSLKKRVHQMEEEKFQEAIKGGEGSRGKGPFNISNMSNEQRLLNKAREMIQSETYEIDDCAKLIENFVTLLAKKKLTGDMVEMGLIYELIRRCSLSADSEGAEAQHPVLTKVTNFFNNSSKVEVLEFFSGIKTSGPYLTPDQYAPRLKKKKSSPSFQEGKGISDSNPSIISFPQLNNNLNQGRQIPNQGLVHANAQVGLSATMLQRFNYENPQNQFWRNNITMKPLGPQ